MENTGNRYMQYEAWECWRNGEPLPVDLYYSLVDAGLNPEALIQAFDDDVSPPLNDGVLAQVMEREDEYQMFKRMKEDING